MKQPASGVSVRSHGSIREVVLARPAKRNALTAGMIGKMRRAFAAAAVDDSINVVLVRAEGPHFCAGFDLTTLNSDELPEERMERELTEFFRFSLEIRDHPKPTICLVQGANVAGGLMISQACDIVVAADNAYFFNPLPRMGGVGLEVLVEPFDIGFRRAKRLLFTGDRIGAVKAAEYGMVTDVVSDSELLSYGRDLAKRIAAMPPLTLRYIKRSLNHAQDIAGMRAALEDHFTLHQFGHVTQESRRLLHEDRKGTSLNAYFKRRDAERP